MATSAFCIIGVMLTVFLVLQAHSLFLPKRITTYGLNDRIIDPKKRPFCNAFTGCGRKRSNVPALSPNGEEIDEPISSLLELNAEPAVEDLSRQIMSEAKLWEALQEARKELNRRKQESLESTADDAAQSRTKGATATCALPPCYI